MNILVFPNKILSQTASPVKNIDNRVDLLIKKMIETMYIAKGVGLAANQVGELVRVIVMDCNEKDRGQHPLTLLNPVITHTEGEESLEEGCLSVPGYSAPVKRAALVQVKGLDSNGKEVSIEADGLLARCLQHEIDHLDGKCFVERMGAMKKTLFRKKWNKIRPGDFIVPEEYVENQGG